MTKLSVKRHSRKQSEIRYWVIITLSEKWDKECVRSAGWKTIEIGEVIAGLVTIITFPVLIIRWASSIFVISFQCAMNAMNHQTKAQQIFFFEIRVAQNDESSSIRTTLSAVSNFGLRP